MELLPKVEATIHRHAMFGRGDGVVVACSGGPDSLTLLGVLHELQQKLELALIAVYVDHGLRPEAGDEGLFVTRVAADLGIAACVRKIPFDLKSLQGQSLQAAAREARYSLLSEVAGDYGAKCIATGHTADDQAETLVMRMMRGTGYRGLAGIPYVNGRLRRPILDVRRFETEAYCADWGVSPVHDPSNAKDAYQRNRIRHWVMPKLAEVNPNYVASLTRLAETAQVENEWIEGVVEKNRQRLAVVEDGGWWCEYDGFLQLPLALQRRLFRRFTQPDAEDVPEVDYEHVTKALATLKKQQTGAMETLPGNVIVVCEKDGFWVGYPHEAKAYCIPLHVPGEVDIPGTNLTLTAEIEEGRSWSLGELQHNQRKRKSPWQPPHQAEYLDWDKVGSPLLVRNRQVGDRYQPLGLRGSKKVQDVFVDAGVPRRWRDRLPLLVDSNSVLWVTGSPPAEAVKITPSTKRALKLQLRGQA